MKKKTMLLIILGIYLLSFLVALYGASFFILPLWQSVLLIDVFMTLLIYLFSLLLKNASLYDPYWSVIPPVLLLYYMVQTNSFTTLNILVLTLVSIWATRLTVNWAIEFESFKKQDWRYDLIKKKSKKLYPIANLFGIQLMPTLMVYAQIYVGIQLMSLNEEISLYHVMPSLVMLGAVYIQHISDLQMRTFRKNKNKSGVIDIGLWQYSRHPNYFGEIMVWVGLYGFYFLSTLSIDETIVAPILMISLFMFISIPMMEKKILSTRPLYKQYQKEVSMLIPWFKKTSIMDNETE